MFGSYKEELDELREYLLSEIGMRPRYVSAFLSAYGRRMAKRLRKAEQMVQGKGLGRFATPVDRLGLLAGGVTDLGVAVVATAYRGYMGDLRRGKHVGTDVEKAIWAILDECRDDELSELDAGLAKHIGEHVEEKFPTLYGDVLRHERLLDDDDSPPIPITDNSAPAEGQPRKGQPTLEEPLFGDTGTKPSLVFMGSMPPEGSTPTLVIPFRDQSQGTAEIRYYGNPKTIGGEVGMPDLFKYPHLAVVRVIGDQNPRLIVRVEDGGFGPPMLCSLDQSGAHSHFGEWPKILDEECRDELSELDAPTCFIKKAIEIAGSQLPPGALSCPPWQQGQRVQRVIIACPSCSASLRVPKSRSGNIRCPSCRALFSAAT